MGAFKLSGKKLQLCQAREELQPNVREESNWLRQLSLALTNYQAILYKTWQLPNAATYHKIAKTLNTRDLT